MRKINLKFAQLAKEGDPVPYAALIRNCLNATEPNKPIMLDEQRKRVRVLDALEAAGDEVFMMLEDADAKVLEECVRKMPWAMLSPGIVEFSDSVIEDCKASFKPPAKGKGRGK